MTIIGFYGSSEIEGWRMKVSKYLNDFTIVDLVSAEGEQADIALFGRHRQASSKKCRICVA